MRLGALLGEAGTQARTRGAADAAGLREGLLKRNKTDAHDAAAICEAVARPTMRFVPIKSEADQATLMLHRLRASFVEKRTAAANQLRAAFAEFGIIAPVGACLQGALAVDRE